MKVFICGNFGYKKNSIDGQSIKTKIFKDAIEQFYSKDIAIVDTAEINNNIVSSMCNIIKNYIKSDISFILPAQRAILILIPLYTFLKFIFKKDIRYIVIGGWLPEFLNKNKIYIKMCKHLDGIYVETKYMKDLLNSLGLKNVYIMPNMKPLIEIKKEISKNENIINIIFLSRVIKEKGVELVIESIIDLVKNKKISNIKLDIYGPIEEDYKIYINKLMSDTDKCEYKGTVPYEKVYEVISKYDLMVFPTFYSGEGFAGAIIDAYMCGVPVVASDWKYNSEIVENGVTGCIFKSKDVQDLTNKLMHIIENKNLIKDMKENCIRESVKYSCEYVMKDFISTLK